MSKETFGSEGTRPVSEDDEPRGEEIHMTSRLYPITTGVIVNLSEENEYIQLE